MVATNTLSSIDVGIREIDEFTDEELVDAYRFTFNNEFPCPSYLFARMIEIARLRKMAASGSCGSDVLLQEAQRIFQQIASFEPASWEEPYDLPGKDTARILASAFKAAVSLYCCASLPASATDERSAAWSLPIITSQRKILLREVSNAAEKSKNMREPLLWPLAVCGYAATKGSSAERSLVTRLLTDMARSNSQLPGMVHEKITNFWLHPAEGNWDDCWRGMLLFVS